MEYRTLGNTALKVSAIALGTMTWGRQNTEADAHAQLDRAVAAGVNLIDAAEMYPTPPDAETFGRTESFIGSWLHARPGVRAKIVLATKVTGANNKLPHIRDGKANLSRGQIAIAIEGSLKRLRTDHVDLYQTHSPDRATNVFGRHDYVHDSSQPGTPIEETLDALGDLVKAGKVRHVGVSNETAWGVARHLALAGGGRPRIQAIQNAYSLVNRLYDVGLAEMSIRENCGLLAYSPLGGGTLSGKYLGGAKPPGARMTLFDRFKRYSGPRAEPATAAYVSLAREAGLDPAQMALAFARQRPFVTSIIIGATTLAQLDSDIASAKVTLPPDLLARIDAIHAGNPNPCP